ncbi:MAG: hypothetical protein Q7U04_11270 [Bacteriovorax sp.]|nr:hypothetical protein [Bacteriovorax sp.]
MKNRIIFGEEIMLIAQACLVFLFIFSIKSQAGMNGIVIPQSKTKVDLMGKKQAYKNNAIASVTTPTILTSTNKPNTLSGSNNSDITSQTASEQINYIKQTKESSVDMLIQASAKYKSGAISKDEYVQIALQVSQTADYYNKVSTSVAATGISTTSREGFKSIEERNFNRDHNCPSVIPTKMKKDYEAFFENTPLGESIAFAGGTLTKDKYSDKFATFKDPTGHELILSKSESLSNVAGWSSHIADAWRSTYYFDIRSTPNFDGGLPSTSVAIRACSGPDAVYSKETLGPFIPDNYAAIDKRDFNRNHNCPSIIPAQMQSDYLAFFNNRPAGESIPFAGGTLVRANESQNILYAADNTVTIFTDPEGNRVKLSKESSLYQLALENKYLAKAWKDTYGFDPKNTPGYDQVWNRNRDTSLLPHVPRTWSLECSKDFGFSVE